MQPFISSTNAENVAKLVFEAADLASGKWVGKERILEAEDRIVRSREYLEQNLPRYVLGKYFECNAERRSFRTLMTLVRQIARYSKRAIVRHKVNRKCPDGQWRTGYVYRLVAYETKSVISFKKAEKLLRSPTTNEIRIQKDSNYPSKAFANTTWEEVYAAVKAGYDKGQFKAYYEQRDPTKPCNFHVDIDDEAESEASFDEDVYLNNIRKDFDAFGIDEPWMLQKSCGISSSGKYKVSYHLTIPAVRFESHKHLKRWFLSHCTKTPRQGVDKNGKRTTTNLYHLGKTKIDMSVYSKGAWRFPMCAKEGSNRVLRYLDEPMTLEVFKRLSIHYIAPNARTIQVELPKDTGRVGQKRSHVAGIGQVLSEEEKKRFQLEGEFFYGQMRPDGWQYIKATSKSMCIANAKVEKEKARSVRDKAHSDLNVAIAKEKRARVEYDANRTRAMEEYKQQRQEPKERKRALLEKKQQILSLQKKVTKDHIVAEFFRQCKRHLSVDFLMDINDSQKELFHFKNDGKDFPIKVIYEKSEITIDPHAKIVTTGNNDPRIAGATKGTYRRGVSDIFESEFVEDGTEDPTRHRYKKDKLFLEKFNDDAFKVAFFHILLPYAKKYCNSKEGLTVPKKYSDHFKQCIDDGDEFTAVLDEFVVTQDDNDCVSKKEVMDIVDKLNIPQYMKVWKFVLNKFKSKRTIRRDDLDFLHYIMALDKNALDCTSQTTGRELLDYALEVASERMLAAVLRYTAASLAHPARQTGPQST
eukprot:g78.t1